MYKHFIGKVLCLVALLLTTTITFAQDPVAGETLFKNNCASCHSVNMKTDGTGPALQGLNERWADFPREDLYAWIRNSSKLAAAGTNAYATKMAASRPDVMTAFPNFSDADIENVLSFIENKATEGCALPPCNDVNALSIAETGSKQGSQGTNWTMWIILAGLAILAVFLARIVSNLNKMAAYKAGEEVESKTLAQTLTSRSVIGTAIFGLVILGSYLIVDGAIDIGRQQGYAPQQPIKFSHELHAGINGIDCQYCHDGARRSKHSVIPATNTCMNCHKAVKGKDHSNVNLNADSKTEISKIYASAGFNPNNGQYFKEGTSNEDVKAAFSTWFEKHYVDAYVADKKLKADDAKDAVKIARYKEEIKADVATRVKASTEGFINKPIEWVRVHNLPDHVYFNHAQHVKVGKIACQECHGKVEEMEVLEQHSPLSMGWCINCHRTTEVQFSDNPYYESYEKYHKDLKEGKIKKVTVEDIGGLECQKCHY